MAMIRFGLSAEDFFEQQLDRKPYLQRAALSAAVEWSDLDQVLAIAEMDAAAIQLFLNGQVAPQLFVEESVEFGRQTMRLNKHRFYDLLQRGATLVINQIERYSLQARRLGAAVAQFTGMQTTSNAYVSFGGDGTFGKHWDTHDVMVLQLLGRKHWQVFAPSWPMPLSNQTSERMQLACPATPEFEAILEPGDLLYIPRGWWHKVTPYQEGSLHLSIGAYLPTMIEYISWLCARYLPQHVAARHYVHSENLHLITGLTEIIASAGLDERNLAEFNKEMRQRTRLISEFNTATFNAAGNSSLHDEVRLILTTSEMPDAQSGEIRINGGRIRLDDLGYGIVTAMNQQAGMTFGALCQRLRAVKRHDLVTAVMALARHELINLDYSPVA